jgi:peptidyl-prolyl cis-trans isomerase D
MLAQVKVTPEAVKAYYEANLKTFELPERLRAEYLVLSREQLAEQLTIGEEQIKAAYQAYGARYRQPEERRASHVLLMLAKNADAEAVKAAEAKAADILAQARRPGADFARLAKQHSQDPGSADKGGDLDWFGRGAMVKPFEEAVFTLKEGQVAEVVRSDFGLHVIKLTGIRTERARPLEEVRGEIAQSLRAELAAKQYAESAEGFSNIVYEQSDSLQPAADKYKLRLQQSDWLQKGGQARGPLAHPKLLAALFSDDALKNKRNTDAIEVSPNVLVAARIVEHKPAVQQGLDTVAPTIEKFLAAQEAAKLAAREGERRLALLQGGEKGDLSWSPARTVTRAAAQGLRPEAAKAVFKADAGKLPAYAGIATPTGYSLYRITQARPFAAGSEAPQAAALRAEYARLVAEEEAMAWIATLKDKYPVKVNQAALETKDR